MGVVDTKLLRKECDDGEFSARFGQPMGSGCCRSEKDARRFGSIPEGMDFRVTVYMKEETEDEWAIIWVRPADFEAFQETKRQKEREERAAKQKGMLMKAIFATILYAVLAGVFLLVVCLVINAIFGTQANLKVAFLIGVGVVGALKTIGSFLTIMSA